MFYKVRSLAENVKVLAAKYEYGYSDVRIVMDEYPSDGCETIRVESAKHSGSYTLIVAFSPPIWPGVSLRYMSGRIS